MDIETGLGEILASKGYYRDYRGVLGDREGTGFGDQMELAVP